VSKLGLRVGGDSSAMAVEDDGEESTERPVSGRMLRPEDGRRGGVVARRKKGRPSLKH
jgi:hypothetical protein